MTNPTFKEKDLTKPQKCELGVRESVNITPINSAYKVYTIVYCGMHNPDFFSISDNYTPTTPNLFYPKDVKTIKNMGLDLILAGIVATHEKLTFKLYKKG